MIVFEVRIQEDAGGKVRVHCETPPGHATAAEINAGMEFKAKFREWAGGVIDRDWKRVARPSKN